MAQAPNQGIIQRAQEFFRGNAPQGENRGTRQNNQQQGNNNQQQNQNQPQNRQQQQNQNNQNQGDLNNPENRQTPFDAYKGLWDNVDNSAEQAPDFKLEDKLINETADRLDFLQGLPEDLQEGLQTAFGEHAPVVAKLFNHLGRKAYATSLTHNTALTDKYLKVKDGFSQKGLGRSIREHMVLTGLDANDAAQKHPIVKETLRMIGKQIAQKHPDATPKWIEDAALKFFTEMHGALNPSPEATEQLEAKKPGGQEFNWDEWAKSDIKRDV